MTEPTGTPDDPGGRAGPERSTVPDRNGGVVGNQDAAGTTDPSRTTGNTGAATGATGTAPAAGSTDGTRRRRTSRRTRRAARRPAGPPDAPGAEAPSPAAPGDAAAATAQQDFRMPGRRTRRSRSATGSPADAPPAPAAPVVPAARQASSPPPVRSRRNRAESSAERMLRSLVSTRPTQLSPTAAMRARELAIPTAEDLAAAAENLVIVRRNYVPPTPLNTGRRSGRAGGRGGSNRRQVGNSGGVGSNS